VEGSREGCRGYLSLRRGSRSVGRLGRRRCRGSRGLESAVSAAGKQEIGGLGVPADSLPITNVTGDLCFTAWFRALLAQERKVCREVRDNGILGKDIGVGRAPPPTSLEGGCLCFF